jgi:hypothetical protein
MSNPHDALFKYTFSQPEHAARLIRDNLPASVAKRVEWATLEKLPGSPIIPLVLYHGDKGWSPPTGFLDVVDLDARDKSALAAFLPDFRFLLDDLSGRSDQQLRARAMTQLGILTLLSLQRLPNAPDPVAVVAEMSDLMAAVINAPSGVQALTAILCYLFKVSDSETERVKEVLQSRVGPRAREALMTTAERLIQQGRAEGEARGRAEGEARGRAELLKKLMTLKFGPLSPETEKRVSSAAIADLDRWSERMLNAQYIEEIFN